MKTKDSSSPAVDPVDHYWMTTILEDRAECAGAPLPPPEPAAKKEDRR
jgi:hypothetical protein